MDDKSFTVFTYYELGNNLYPHWSEGLTMVIVKDGVEIKLNQNEVVELVASLPKTIGGTY